MCVSAYMVPCIPWQTVLVWTIVLPTWPGSADAPQCSIQFHYYLLLYLVHSTYASGTITWADVALKHCISSGHEHQGSLAWCSSGISHSSLECLGKLSTFLKVLQEVYNFTAFLSLSLFPLPHPACHGLQPIALHPGLKEWTP